MIAVECYADTRMVLTLGAATRAVSHARGKGQVLDMLRQGRASVGLVDEDPASAEYPEMRNYQLMETVGSLRLLRHRGAAERRLIMICPRLEEWLLGRAEQAGIDPAQWGLPSDPRKLHNSGRYDRHPRFKSFVERLLQIDVEVKKLRDWITM